MERKKTIGSDDIIPILFILRCQSVTETTRKTAHDTSDQLVMEWGQQWGPDYLWGSGDLKESHFTKSRISHSFCLCKWIPETHKRRPKITTAARLHTGAGETGAGLLMGGWHAELMWYCVKCFNGHPKHPMWSWRIFTVFFNLPEGDQESL